MTAALLVVTLFAQSLLPFFYAAEAQAGQRDGQKAQTFMVCTAEGYKLISTSGDAESGDTGSVLHCPLCLGAQQLAFLPPPAPNALPALSETALRLRPAPDAGHHAGIASRWPEARAPPAIV